MIKTKKEHMTKNQWYYKYDAKANMAINEARKIISVKTSKETIMRSMQPKIKKLEVPVLISDHRHYNKWKEEFDIQRLANEWWKLWLRHFVSTLQGSSKMVSKPREKSRERR